MSIVANFDINLRGNTSGVDQAADKTSGKIAELRAAVDKHGSGIAAKFAEMGGKMRAAFAAMPGAGVITAVLQPAVYLGGAIGKAFMSSVAGIGSATTAMGAFGAATTIATGGLNLIVAAVAATGAAAIGAGMAWTGMGLASMKGINEAQKAADRLGMSVESLQGFAFKGKVELEELSDVFFKMEKAIGHAGAGGGGGTNAAAILGKTSKGAGHAEHALHGVAGAWAKLGLTQEKLKSLRPEEAFGQIADKFEGIKNQSERAALAAEIWGRKGQLALKVMAGGSAGIAESLAQAQSLGVIVSGSQAKQVAEAAGALRVMQQAMSGLGKTAAITIAPFVKMLAESLTEGMKWINQYRDNLIDFAYSAEFVFKNFGDYAKLYSGKAILAFTEFGNYVTHLCTDVLPQLFISFGQMLSEGFSTGFAGGLGKGWEKAVEEIKASMARSSGEIEDQLRQGVNAFEKDLNGKRQAFLDEKKKALNIPEPGASAAGGGSKDNSAVAIGSAEAFKIIAGDKEDKMFAAQNKTISVLQKIYEEMRKKRAKQAQIVEAGAF